MGKRIRHPKPKEQIKKEKKEAKKEEKLHFVLDVHDSVMGSTSKMNAK